MVSRKLSPEPKSIGMHDSDCIAIMNHACKGLPVQIIGPDTYDFNNRHALVYLLINEPHRVKVVFYSTLEVDICEVLKAFCPRHHLSLHSPTFVDDFKSLLVDELT